MKIKKERITDISIGISDEQSFKLDQDSGMLYDILRSKMYREPIPSIVREVSSNARDANREAGRGDVPIEVYFENGIECEKNYLFDSDSTSINFKDCGLGMTPDRITDIYLTYGASDKRNTDGLTGGFGLGAKTPFAAADMFSVTTVCDYKDERRKYTYVASIDKSNKGKFSLLEEELTEEETGTVVSMPIENDNVHKFKNACAHYFSYWDIAIKGFDRIIPMKEYDEFNIYSVNQESKLFLIIDGIYYPLMEHASLVTKDFFKDLGIKLDIGLKFNTGDLEVQPTREDVRYTDKTIDTINNRINSLNLSEIISEAFREVECNNLKGFSLHQLHKHSSHIKDNKLKSLISLYPKLRGHSQLQSDYTDYVPNLIKWDTYRHKKTPSESKINLKSLINHVGNDTPLILLSPSSQTFKYKRNILFKIKQSCSLTFRAKEEFNTVEESDIALSILTNFSDIKYDHEIEYVSPTKVSRINTGVQTRNISFRVLSKDRVINIPNRTFDINTDIICVVPNLNTIDQTEFKLLNYIKEKKGNNFIYVSERYKKAFVTYITLDVYKKSMEYRMFKKSMKTNNYNYTLHALLEHEFCNKTLYLFHEEISKHYKNVLVPIKKFNAEQNYFDRTNINNYTAYGEYNATLRVEIQAIIKSILDKNKELYSLVFGNYNITKDFLNKLKTLKNE